ALIDPLGGIVWSLDCLHEYEVEGGGDAESELVQDIRRHGGLLESKQNGVFEIRFTASKELVSFRVLHDHDHWSVTETGSRPFIAQDFNTFRQSVPEKTPRKIGTIRLKTAVDDTTTPIHDIRGFCFDSKGQIGFIRSEADSSSFVLVDQDSKLLKTVDLGPVQPASKGCASLGDDEWVVSLEPGTSASKQTTSRVNSKTGEVTQLKTLDGSQVHALTSAGDGSFVALAAILIHDTPESYSPDDTVVSYDKEGKEKWAFSSSSTNQQDDSWLLAPEDLAVTSTGEVAVLDNIRKVIQIYSNAGKYLKTIDLE